MFNIHIFNIYYILKIFVTCLYIPFNYAHLFPFNFSHMYYIFFAVPKQLSRTVRVFWLRAHVLGPH